MLARREWQARGSRQQQALHAHRSTKQLHSAALQNLPYSWESHLSEHTALPNTFARGRTQLWTLRFTGTELWWLCGQHHSFSHLKSSASKALWTNEQVFLCCTSNLVTCRLFVLFFFSCFLAVKDAQTGFWGRGKPSAAQPFWRV